MTDREHPVLRDATRELNEGKLDRRDFLRIATLLGVSAVSAYTMAGLPTPAEAQTAAPKKGGTLRIGMRVQDLSSPHTYSWIESANAARQTLDYLTHTGPDNITRPHLVEKWTASEDLKSWTFVLRKDVKWRKGGNNFTADDAIWNIQRVLDPKTGSSVVGLLKGFMLVDFETGEKDDKGAAKKSTKLWDPKAIEKVDEYTFRLNGQAANLSIPEALYHYPFLMMDPAEGGKFGVGSNGTGAYELVELDIGRRAVFTARKDGYFAGGPWVDRFEVVDIGEDAAAAVGAMASKQIDMEYQGSISTLPAMEKMPHVQMLKVNTAYTAVARVHSVKPFDDK